MRQDLDQSPIVYTSDFTGFAGLRVVIRKGPDSAHFGTDRKDRATQVSTVFAREKLLEISYPHVDGAVATFEIEPRFMADVVGRAGIVPVKLEAVPPARFLVNRRVDHLCSLLVHETEQGARFNPLYFESLATALVLAVVSPTDARLLEDSFLSQPL